MSAAQDWLKFAWDDLRSAEILIEENIFNMVCFHAQQGAEKSLKAFLRQHENKVPFIHILEELCERCTRIDPAFSRFRESCVAMDIFYQPTRYPEAPAGSLPEGLPNREQAESALQDAKEIFKFVSDQLS